MRVVIAGGHGKIALLLERLLDERGDQVVGLIRNPAHVADVHKAGTGPPVALAQVRPTPSPEYRCLNSAKSARQKALVLPDPSAAGDPRSP
jgi:hypothetical protein